ncbi:MAG: CBS domain-containing protein [Nodosilinea sp.]
MTTNLVTVQPTDTALAAATLLAEYQVSCVAVVDPTAAGVLRQDVLRFQARQLNLAKLSVRAIMRDLQLCLKLEDSL